MTATLKYKDVLNDAIKLMFFSYSLEGAAMIWYEKEPPNSILTWDDLVNKFVNQFFHPSKTTHLKNEISRFTQRFEETFGEAWDRFKEMLRACPHHGFSELTQIDTFYNGFTEQDQDSLNAASGGATQALWLKRLLSKLTHSDEEKITILVDNKSAIALMKNPVFHGRSKHIDTKYHFIRECVERDDIQCMRTRNSYFPNNSSVTIPMGRNKRRTPNVVKPELRTIVEVAPMADNRTMEELLQAPTEGYGEAIIIPEINADHLEIKTNLLQLTGMKRFKEMLRACPHHKFTELAQIDTFYNGLNDNYQDSLNAAAGGNLLSKTTREALQIIENKSKVLYSRNKPNVSRMNTTSRENASKTDDRIVKLADKISTLVDIFAKKVVTPALVKAIEESCVTCGGPHAYYNFPNTDSNQPIVCMAMGTYNQVAPKNHVATTWHHLVLLRCKTIVKIELILNFGYSMSNTIPNPKGEMKEITTWSGVAYEGPSIPTLKKVVERETDETTDKEQANFQGSTAYIQPLVTPILEPDVPKTLPKPNIPYPSRLNDQKLREKATN
nr:reverse transcriptase domain-containing protein [Tanacetum cinerariifolium]